MYYSVLLRGLYMYMYRQAFLLQVKVKFCIEQQTGTFIFIWLRKRMTFSLIWWQRSNTHPMHCSGLDRRIPTGSYTHII